MNMLPHRLVMRLCHQSLHRLAPSVLIKMQTLGINNKNHILESHQHEHHHQNFQCHYFHTSPIRQDLMEFFDDKENWGADRIRTGRAWKIDELRIKSNSDLHKLWFVLYKERNMLLTMKEAAEQESEIFVNPERIDKVEESMKNLEDVVRERNKAYWELEVGEGEHGERKRVFRRDQFGRYRWIGCSEHLVPYWMNKKWRFFNSPGHGKDVDNFVRRMREKMMTRKFVLKSNSEYTVRQLLKRFPNLDMEYLQERYPEVDVQKMKDNLDDLSLTDRVRVVKRNPKPVHINED